MWAWIENGGTITTRKVKMSRKTDMPSFFDALIKSLKIPPLPLIPSHQGRG
jgi:hypothetical protein